MVLHPEIQKNILTKSFKKTMEMRQAFRLLFVGLHARPRCTPASSPNRRPAFAKTKSAGDAAPFGGAFPQSERSVSQDLQPTLAPPRRDFSARESVASQLSGLDSLSAAEARLPRCPNSRVLRALSSAG